MTPFFGKYRGKVESNLDPLMQGRLQVSVPAVLGTEVPGWAMPCVPYAGPGVGFLFLPPVGAHVWVEFEGGDPDYPVWTGCFWGPGEAPQPAIPSIKTLKTEAFSLTVNETVPGATITTLELQGGTKLTVDPTGATLAVPSGILALSGLQITLNNDALVVLP
ncbi:phage baseplate assembly protein V [Roseomonas populi]|uniref:Phage baseplate assembly protein V n=1 Tax=Roseomonas populi TaxID=3121582 RepID=A0ABT1X6H0_9PROT|nr:phage baseplate assembly protein V [Roseomonas pecuniae]MCR0982757.1 phage baseplate assembly protein V [Roseomonas pecuniae]